jgi:hypothetical protein
VINKQPTTSVGFQSPRRAEADDERTFEAITVRDALWKWRSVLPPEPREDGTTTLGENNRPMAVSQRDVLRAPLEMSAALLSSRQATFRGFGGYKTGSHWTAP